jgi:acetyl-CoA synthetase
MTSSSPAGAADERAPGPATEDAWAELHASFAWRVPDRFNIADVCLHRWAHDTPDALAIVHEREKGASQEITYGVMQRKARRLSNALATLGVLRGDRVAVILPQRPQTAVSLLAIVQMGAVAVPLSTLFGPEALRARLADSGAKVAIVDDLAVGHVRDLRDELPALQAVIAVGRAEGRTEASWTDIIANAAPGYQTANTSANDPAFLIYTSGTTGPAKGALIPHRAMIGNLSGFIASQNWYPTDAGAFWSPADWAWTGGLWDALLPVLYFGRTIVASSGRFDAAEALKLMERRKVTHAFLFPTALKAMMRVAPEPRASHPGLKLQAVMSAGETVGEMVFEWCRDKLGVVVNEMFGQTEANYVVGNCGRHLRGDGTAGQGWPRRAGSMGRPYPGHRVAVIDDAGSECPPGVEGEIAVHPRDLDGRRDPVFFLGYWHNEAATHARFTGTPFESWFRTGDRAALDAEGYFWYAGRADDQFKTSGYRVGPAEIEGCLARHPAVAQVAVVPKPDSQRGAVVKAFVIVAEGAEPDVALVEALQELVRGQLAPYETPKEIEFVETLPMTTIGKLQRNVLRQLEIDRAKGVAPPALPAKPVKPAGRGGKKGGRKSAAKPADDAARAQAAVSVPPAAAPAAVQAAAVEAASARAADDAGASEAVPPWKARQAAKEGGQGAKGGPGGKGGAGGKGGQGAKAGQAGMGGQAAKAGKSGKPGKAVWPGKAVLFAAAAVPGAAPMPTDVAAAMPDPAPMMTDAANDADDVVSDEDDAIAEYALLEPIPDDEDEASVLDEDD